MRIVMRQDWHRAGYSIWLLNERGNQYQVVHPIELKFSDDRTFEKDIGFCLPEPTLFLRNEQFKELQRSLADEFTHLGHTDFVTPGREEMKAVQRHLEDMRSLVFERKQLK